MKKLFFVLLGIIGLSASYAHAHTRLSASVPADATVVSGSPNEIVLEFSTGVRLTALTMHRGDQETDLGPVPADTQQKFVVAVSEALLPGDYLIAWRAVGADSHVVSGEIHFTVSPALSAASPQTQAP